MKKLLNDIIKFLKWLYPYITRSIKFIIEKSVNVLRNLFPKKLDFKEEFAKDPVSKESEKAFSLLSNDQVENYFYYEKSHWAIAIFLDHKNRNSFTLKQVLNSLIDRVEGNYRERGENSLDSYFDVDGSREELIEKKLLRSEFGWESVFRISLVNLESVCLYLNRKPIPELLEDVATIKTASDINRKKRLEIRAQRAKEVKEDYEQKREYLIRLVNELESNGTDRQKIKEIVVQKFAEDFTNSIKSMVRIDGEWAIKFYGGDSVNPVQEMVIKPTRDRTGE
jgi:hypothetical protein